MAQICKTQLKKDVRSWESLGLIVESTVLTTKLKKLYSTKLKSWPHSVIY